MARHCDTCRREDRQHRCEDCGAAIPCTVCGKHYCCDECPNCGGGCQCDCSCPTLREDA